MEDPVGKELRRATALLLHSRARTSTPLSRNNTSISEDQTSSFPRAVITGPALASAAAQSQRVKSRSSLAGREPSAFASACRLCGDLQSRAQEALVCLGGILARLCAGRGRAGMSAEGLRGQDQAGLRRGKIRFRASRIASKSREGLVQCVFE